MPGFRAFNRRPFAAPVIGLLLAAAGAGAVATPQVPPSAQATPPASPGARLAPAAAPRPAITRTDLQRHDLSVAGHEAIQARVDFAPGAIAPRHRHPGEEIVFILRGTLEYRLDGQAPVTLNPGGTLFIPAGAVHAVRNTGNVVASELATYVVAKGQPLITLVP
jgi:quercetin dioxygenase-like cupin family protein